MQPKQHHENPRSVEDIGGQASLYDWLLSISRPRRRPRPLPGHLYADLGLAPPQYLRHWSDL
ncbi:hypothetical protein [Devosia sp. XK-2]|uniref:hypothetical protein n=1 Tax=Devosia sp. XK-2 TaxID=3126689 RepID=UPI0030D0172A